MSCTKLIAFLLISTTAFCAASYRTSAAGGASAGTSDRTVTITPAVGDLLVVFCDVAANAQNAPTMTDNNGSGTYTRITIDDWAISAINYRMSIFVRTALMVNTTSTVITCTTGSNTAGNVVAVAVSGMTRVGANAVRQSKGTNSNAAGSTPNPAFDSSALTGNMTLGAVGNGTSPATLTTPTNWTERQDVGQSNDTVGLEVVTRDSGFTGTTVTWGSTSASIYAAAIIELDATAVSCAGTRTMVGVGC